MQGFIVSKNYFCFLLGLYSFTKIEFLEPQSAHATFCANSLFTTYFGVIDLSFVSFLHFKQYVFCFLMYALKDPCGSL